jgi:multisubunit Na+/H+ antiporter MnhC subunit
MCSIVIGFAIIIIAIVTIGRAYINNKKDIKELDEYIKRHIK